MEEYKTEKEFLEKYNPLDYPSFAVTTDILVFGISSEDDTNYKKLDSKKMSILLIKRDTHPFKNKWCLPGGFVNIDENLDEAPKRILKKETGLDNIYLEQLYTFGNVNRDPRMRVITSSYMALINKDKLENKLSDNSSWFDILKIEEENNIVKIVLSNNIDTIDFSIKKKLRELTTDRYSFEIDNNSSLAFDNPLVILSGIERLKNKIEYTDIVFNMMPEYFTLGELQKVYEVILGKKMLDPAFRRIIANKVLQTDKYKTGEGHRPSRLFKYNNKK
jgi:ADP-ribose pyrophosphatase YjhB (NUDIX family)